LQLLAARLAHAPDLAALINRAQRACDDLATVRDEVAITGAETRRLIAIARQMSSADSSIVPDTTVPLIVEEPPTLVVAAQLDKPPLTPAA
jgi:hypothetical protein